MPFEDDEDTKPYTFSCPQCGASPTQPGRTQIRTALVSAGEAVEWLAVVEGMVHVLDDVLDGLKDPSGRVQVKVDRARDNANSLGDRLRQLIAETENLSDQFQ